MVYIRETEARAARYRETEAPLSPAARALLRARGIERLYAHQAEAIDHARAGRSVVVVTGTASGKSLCYQVPILEMLAADPDARALLLFPTKALCQDQFRAFSECESRGVWGYGRETGDRRPETGRPGAPQEPSPGLPSPVPGPPHSHTPTPPYSGVYDGDTPANTRRKLRDHASMLFTNPDMLHAALMPQHSRWAPFLSQLKLLVLDELHVYSGIFGSNMANLLRRLGRLFAHYGCDPLVIACSATIGNPKELAERLTGKEMALVEDDGSPRGRRTFVFWNPPRIRGSDWRSRRSANVEAHELMAVLVQRGVPTITFSKAKMTAEMIHRYVCDRLRESAPHLMQRVTPYRGGYLPEERREIERRLFSGELIGVSTTPALELGIDVGGLDASIIVGYPGTLASFFQQAGRAGRQERDSLVVLVGLDTTINQYVMSHPEYLFDRPIEEAIIDPDNPFVITGHLRCAAHELALPEVQAGRFGPHAEMVLKVLEENRKVKRVGGVWYHTATETPQHEVPLRASAEANTLIQDADTGMVLGEVNRYDAEPLLHPEAIYMHLGDTYRVLELDMERNLARVQKVEVDYYTQPLGGTDVHHIDHTLREKPFGTGRACWGEVTSHFNNPMFEKIHFYSLDALSRHGLDLPTLVLETMAFWIVPPEDLMLRVREAGLDAFHGLRAVGYATRMLLPLFITCNTADFSHSVGSANSPWNAVFIYERYPLGLGFTEKAYDRLHEILPAVLENVRNCPCEDGCPCCVGKPLRQFTVWNVERGEASVPSKQAALMILEGLLADGANLHGPDIGALSEEQAAHATRLEQALRRRLERMREPEVFHPIDPRPRAAYPATEGEGELAVPDVAQRAERRRQFERDLRKRIKQKLDLGGLPPNTPRQSPPPGLGGVRGVLPPTAFPGKPSPPPPPLPSDGRGGAASEGDRPSPPPLPSDGRGGVASEGNRPSPPGPLSPRAEEGERPSGERSELRAVPFSHQTGEGWPKAGMRAQGDEVAPGAPEAPKPIQLGDSLAERARRLKRERGK